MTKTTPKKTAAKRAIKTTRAPARTTRSTAPRSRRLAPSVHNSLGELIDKVGDHIEPVLYALICEDQHKMRSTLTDALDKGGLATTAVMVPVLVAQFALTPPVAAVVVGTVAKLLITKGPAALCEELATTRQRQLRKSARKKYNFQR